MSGEDELDASLYGVEADSMAFIRAVQAKAGIDRSKSYADRMRWAVLAVNALAVEFDEVGELGVIELRADDTEFAEQADHLRRVFHAVSRGEREPRK